ncbi:phytanoyl-CoA dioxygenase family protein [Arcicella rosea]|uniref:Ectoine hydroxylase-related dioxygenase (Phytanoyl-CoA dioxygenase family) n=1 Tax=Arcicella rosea TaxID=502909 RepID=A0A841EQX1_9BACT|nr:phytanoyl-CoA dioxygenase family protein [Arcicella rosea]MBB6003078.1 ectoine hydroxylase-related dioxygenase (phytanoyl-CoA dioxygenase family) [Arcicella rosea]
MSEIAKSILEALKEPYELSPEQIEFYQENRYIKLKNVLNKDVIERYNLLIREKVQELNTMNIPLEERDVYNKAFLQIMNIWTHSDTIKEFVFSKRIAKIASDLMQVEGVRLYHDQALFKEPGGGFTPWHADQYYWPLESDKTVTAWIPLQETPLEMGPLEFSAKSHLMKEGRNLKISDDSEVEIQKKLRLGDFQQVNEAFELGEVSFHSGWVFHRAGANKTDKMRQVMTMIYMDKNMKLKQPENVNQQADWETWCQGAKIGKVINTPINPILYEKTS